MVSTATTPLQAAMAAAQAAGKILVDNLDDPGTVRIKQRKDYVSDLDVRAENAIKEHIHRAFPTHGIVAEESAAERGSGEFTWFVDPISSTVNYIHGLPHFAVSIALQHGDKFVLGVVLDPLLAEVYVAERGRGVFLNGARINVSRVANLADSVVCFSIYNRGNVDISPGVARFGRLVEATSAVRRIGSTALEICYVACGRIEAYASTASDVFSVPAGKVILEEAGGLLTDFRGERWGLRSTSVVASNCLVHEALLALLS